MQFLKSPSRFAKVPELANVHGERAHVEVGFFPQGYETTHAMEVETRHPAPPPLCTLLYCVFLLPSLQSLPPSHLHRSISSPGGLVDSPTRRSLYRCAFCLSTPWCSGL